MGTICSQEFCTKPYSEDEIVAAARRLREKSPRPYNAAFVFASSDYLPHLDEFCDILRVEGRIVDVAGCSASGLIGTGIAREAVAGFSLLAVSSPETKFAFFPIADGYEGAEAPAPKGSEKMAGWISLIDPYSLPSDVWIENWSASHPGVPVSGALASGAGNENSVGVFWNGKSMNAGIACGWAGGNLRAVHVLSQGCRPIGEPLTVTRAENNVVFSLGAQPAYQALENAFQTLSEEEKAVARGNLLAGLATNEYVEDFKSGDFLVRSIIGADPGSGAVVIGGIPRIGQTLQYHFRDRQAASLDLQNHLTSLARSIPNPLGGLMFSCVGRGGAFFGDSAHDPSRFAEFLGPIPLAGFFCNGEIGPVRGANLLTGFSASMAVFYDETN